MFFGYSRRLDLLHKVFGEFNSDTEPESEEDHRVQSDQLTNDKQVKGLASVYLQRQLLLTGAEGE